MYSEYAIFEKDNNYLILLPKINFWFKTNRHGLRIFKNLLDKKIFEKELQMKKLIEMGAQCLEFPCSYNIELLEIEFCKESPENQILDFIQNNSSILAEKFVKGVVIERLELLSVFVNSKLLQLGIDYLEINCNNERPEKEIYEHTVFGIIQTVHFKNIVLDMDTIDNIAKLRENLRVEVVIHINHTSEYLYNYIKICAKNDLYFAIDFGDPVTSYYEFYMRLTDFVQSLEWNIDYKKFCSIYNYEKIIKNRLTRKSCGLARDKVYILGNGKIYSCQDCAQRKCFPIGTIYDMDFSLKWREGRVCEKIRELTVETMGECSKCCFRYMCGGQCRMKSFDKYKTFDNKSAYCDDEKKIYVDLLWKSLEEVKKEDQ